jgi:hypothetical protein
MTGLLQRCGAIVGLGLLLAAPVARASEEKRQDLRAAVADLAKSIKDVAKVESQPAVRIGRFTSSGEGLDSSNAGDGISTLLAEALGDFVNPKAVLEVKGDYFFNNDTAVAAVKVIVIAVRVVNTENRKVVKEGLPLEAIIRANGDIAKVLNFTGRLDENGNYEERNKDLQKQQEKKAVFIHPDDRTLISSRKESDYAVQVRVKPQTGGAFQARSAEEKGGQAFVPIEKGEVYEVRLLNYATHEAAITLSVDGIDNFHFTEERASGKPRFSHWILPPAKDGKPGETTVFGWHKTLGTAEKPGQVLSFLVTEHGQGAAAKFPTLAQGKVGTITVAFARSFPEGTTRSAGAETGFGPPREVKQQAVKRVIDPPHDFVTVRYTR